MHEGDRIAALERENERLLDHIDALEAALGADFEPHVCLGLTVQEARVVGLLMKRSRVTRDQIMAVLYGHRHEGEEPEPKIVNVLVCKARKKLARFGIEIKTIWGQGYGLDDEAKKKIARMIERAA